MAQGTRGRWVRVAATGLGVLVCSGLVGCMGTDKDKEKNKIGVKTPAPSPGLPGTPTIGTSGTASRTPAANPYGASAASGSSGIQQTGGFGQQRVGSDGRNMLNTSVPQPNYGGPNSVNPPAMIGAPGQPGIVPNVQPVGSTGTAPSGWGSSNTTPNPVAPANTVAGASPLPPSFNDVPLPPPPPGAATSVPVQPPASAFAPLAPQPPVPPPGVNASAFGK